MARSRRLSDQALSVLAVLAENRQDWLYGLELAEHTGLKSGSLYPILIRLADRGLLEAQWLDPAVPGRPPRHAYRILSDGVRSLQEAGGRRRRGLKESFA